MQAGKITADALSFWLKHKHLNQKELAEKLDVAPNTISQIVNGHRYPSVELLEKIAEALGISLPEFFSCRDDALPDIEFVPLVKAVPRAGTGGLETDGDYVGLYSFHASFLLRKQGTAETMRLFRVAGDSMEPTLFSGDMIMVNTGEAARHVQTGMVYLVRLGDELMVKRLENRPGNMLLIRSDNASYQDIPVNKAEVDGEIEIFGRMVWSCREY
jgi:transcriptional regulator with XRE-family HTH domain